MFQSLFIFNFNSMVKKVITYSVAFLFFVFTFNYLNNVFSSKHRYVNTINDFKQLSKETSIDVLMFGSSHSYTAYNPLIINQEANILSFNLGSDALRVSLTDLILEEALKHTTPKLVILEVYKGSLQPIDTERAKGYQLRGLDIIPNTNLKKIGKVLDIYDSDEYLSVLFPLLRNHSKWHEVELFNNNKTLSFNPKDNYYFSGFVGSIDTIKNQKQRERFYNFRNKKIEKKLNEELLSLESKQDIKRFIDIAKENNIDVLIVSSPDLRSRYNNYTLFDQLAEFCSELDVPFVNLNDHYLKMKLNINDFKDPGHLNTFGSNKASKFLADYINKNYSFPDRKNDLHWKNSEKKFKDFSQIYRYPNFDESAKIKIQSIKNLSDESFHFKSINGHFNDDFKFTGFGVNQQSNGMYQFALELHETTKPETVKKYSIGLKGYSSKLDKPFSFSVHPITKKINGKDHAFFGKKIPRDIAIFDSVNMYIYERKNWNKSGSLGEVTIGEIKLLEK